MKKQCLHLGAFSGGVDRTPCHFPCREPPKCRVRATGPVTWGLGVPGCRPGRRGETEGAGAALTAGRATAGTREARAQGMGGDRRKGARDEGRGRPPGRAGGSERARGRKGAGRGGRAGGRGSGPGRGARGAPGRGADEGRGVPHRRGARGGQGFGERGSPSSPDADSRGGAAGPHRAAAAKGRTRHLPPLLRRPRAGSVLTSSVHGPDPDGHFHFGVSHPAATAETLARLPSAVATGQLFGADPAVGGCGRRGGA